MEATSGGQGTSLSASTRGARGRGRRRCTMGRPLLSSATLAVALLCPVAARAAICDALSWVSVSPGVTYHDCSDSEPAVHVVTISRSLPDYELRVLADPE